MKLLCKCGNIFDFDDNLKGTAEGFEFLIDEAGDEFVIHCTKCDKAVVLCELEEE